MGMRLALGCVALLTGAALSFAQSSAAPERAPLRPLETRHLTVTPSVSAPAAAPGGRLRLFLDVAPKPKMHVYAPEERNYLTVSLRLDASPAFKASPPVFPKGERFFFAPTGETQIVYSHPFRIDQPVTLASARPLRPGTPVTITGTLRYQACDDTVCYVPANLSVNWTVTVR